MTSFYKEGNLRVVYENFMDDAGRGRGSENWDAVIYGWLLIHTLTSLGKKGNLWVILRMSE